MWYQNGRLSLFNGSKVVLGNNTAFSDKKNGVAAGSMLLVFTDCHIQIHEIAAVVSDTELLLAGEYAGCTQSGVRYAIPVFGQGDDGFDHAVYVAQIAAILAGYQSQLSQWKQVLTERGQVTLTNGAGQSVVVKTLPDLTDAVGRMMDKTLNGADIADKAQFVANLGLSDVVHKSDLANHTHTASQITDFTDAVRKVLVSTLAAGQGVSLAYDNVNNQLIISATGNGGGSGGGGSGYTVVTRVGVTANQIFTFALNTAGTMDYSFDAFALKEEAGLLNQNAIEEKFESAKSVNYRQTSALIWDGSLHSYLGSNYSLSLDGAFYAKEIKADGKSISIAVNANDKTYPIPLMTSNNLPSGYLVSSSSIFPGNYAYFAFQQKNGPSTSSWASAINDLPAWLRIDLPSMETVSGYQLAGRTNPVSAYKQQPTAFDVQGSNDGTTWVTVDSQKNLVWASADEIKTFKLSTPVKYSKYRIYISAVNSSPDVNVCVSMFNLFNDVPKTKALLQAVDGNYYSVSNGRLSLISSSISSPDFDTYGFYSSGKILESELVNKLPLKVVTKDPVSVTTKYWPHSQIAVSNSLISLKSYSKLNKISVVSTQKANGLMKMAVSRDLVNWVVWDGSQWVNITSLSIDDAGASALLKNGMSAANINGLTSLEWGQLFNNHIDNIAFAYVLDVPDPDSDFVSLDSITLNLDYASIWKKQTETEVEIRWYPDKVTFKPITAGNYKFAYQQP
ncbi:discoidin domain-containing protein [Dickeya lacustris]|uniref:Discoidin domain-containing protein n=1 Tax=Dickeya lacustris TaxID=2259638 RepID=A0ABY8G701_9GAMM|nr:discoidin domain-containing protein [Dickeya lacustris]WFN55733.1 discoidin domain-containing protein [Dickeya lacustris]